MTTVPIAWSISNNYDALLPLSKWPNVVRWSNGLKSLLGSETGWRAFRSRLSRQLAVIWMGERQKQGGALAGVLQVCKCVLCNILSCTFAGIVVAFA